MDNYSKLKNIAVVAHVDHGKTTMVDELLKQSGTYSDRDEIVERVMDSGEIEKERGITIKAKNCAIFWNDSKVNLLDTPGHADFGGEVERSLMMVDGVLLLVDAAEGCLPQTRFVLSKAMESGIKIGVIINKVDRPDQRIEEVKGEIEDLFLELATFLEIGDFDLDIPFLYSSAKNGWATSDPAEQTDNMKVVLDFMASDYFPEPKVEKVGDLQLLLTNLGHDSYLGSQVIGRIQRGKVEKHSQYTVIGKEKAKNFKVSAIQVYDKLGTAETDMAEAGEIVILAGLEGGQIGDTVVSLGKEDALPRIEVEPPTVGVFVSVSTSPLSGKEGDYLTSRKLEEFLEDLAIVFEELRREGFEFMLSRPEVLFQKDEEGNKTEPYEKLVMDIPDDATGAITEKLSKRKGIMEGMMPIGEGRTRVEFITPSRGLIGYRSRFLTDTRGEGIMSSEYLGYRPYAGDMLARQNGAIIADRAGKMTPYALFNLINLGEQFVLPGEQCYEGMVIGEYSKVNDTNVNAVREKHLSSMRTAGKDVNIVLPPVQPRTLEWALDWIDNDEWVEVTPQTIRIRKKVLPANMRSVVRK